MAEFNRRCRESVFKYEKDWVAFTRRIGYWLDMEHPYVTCHNSYIESVWWILKEQWKAGLIYRGHKSVPFCPRCQTSLSSHEVSQGYRDVSDPSVYVKFKRAGADESFLAWTTTPWTLTCNAALAVAEKETYARVAHKGEVLVLAEALLSALDGEYELLGTMPGADLVGAAYEPLFDLYRDEPGAFRVIAAQTHIGLSKQPLLEGSDFRDGGAAEASRPGRSPAPGKHCAADAQPRVPSGPQMVSRPSPWTPRMYSIIPLRAGLNTYGVLLFAHPDPQYFTPDRREILEIVGTQAVIAIQNASLYHDLEQEKERMLVIQDEARKKLARDLHDGPTQSVSAIAMRVNFARRLMERDAKAASDELIKVEDLARHTTQELRICYLRYDHWCWNRKG